MTWLHCMGCGNDSSALVVPWESQVESFLDQHRSHDSIELRNSEGQKIRLVAPDSKEAKELLS